MLEITDDNFQEEVLSRRHISCLIDFWAPWCKPCMALTPILHEIASKYSQHLIIGSYNVEAGNKIAGTYGINSLPTLILFKDGKAAWTQVGLLPKTKLEQKLENYL